jgi:alpha-D-xyloside xylohydrolase
MTIFKKIFFTSLILVCGALYCQANKNFNNSFYGVWSFDFGVQDKIIPTSTRLFTPDTVGLKKLPNSKNSPVIPEAEITERGVLLKIPLKKGEMIYGLGLQMKDFQMRGSKKLLRVNADPEINTGDSHAPVPFYVTTHGYGVFIDNSRYMTYYLGNKKIKPNSPKDTEAFDPSVEDGWNTLVWPDERLGFGEDSEVIIEIPYAEGVRVLVFDGPTMKDAIARYNLFSGGGTIPPRWGLGFWYRVKSDYTQEQVMEITKKLRARKIPCDVIGLEPNWQTHAYSCSYVWGKRFPQPQKMIHELLSENFKLNLWQHAFVHPTSPIYESMIPYSGNYEVWGGLVPDFITPSAKRIFGTHIQNECIDVGISGFKLDECDNSDFTGFWSFPEFSQFPSGADGEQMHTQFGLRYQDVIISAFDKVEKRTYGLVRNTGAFAAPYPFVLYSDLYDHRTFINSVGQSGFCGLLWCPEVRHAADKEDLIRRLQSTILSPIAMVNGWYLKNPPWEQIRSDLNNKDIYDDDWESTEGLCRDIINLRMQLVPYLHAAFVKYKQNGIAPFRSLVVDYPHDNNTYNLNGQFLIGDNLMAAPVVSGQNQIVVYFPKGDWYNFFTGEKYVGETFVTIDVPIEHIPLFVKSNTVLPLAEVSLSTEETTSRLINVRIYGDNPESFALYEDYGEYIPSLTPLVLTWDSHTQKINLKTKSKKPFYTINTYEHIK